MRILCVSAPLPGHLDWGGYLPAAAELARRGHQVTWASGRAVEQAVQDAGVHFAELTETGWRWPPPPPVRPADLPPDSPAGTYASLRASRALDQWLEPDRVVSAVDALTAVAIVAQPDVIVSEMFILAAGLVAERCGLPFVVAGWPAHAAPEESTSNARTTNSPILLDAQNRLKSILKRCGLQGENTSTSGPPALLSQRLHLSFWSERWFSGARLMPQTRHAGGIAPQALPPDPALPPPNDRPWVFITLGTSLADDPAFYRMAIEATQRMGAVPIVATGSPSRETPSHPYENAYLRDHYELRSILPHTSAAIHHGGAGTTHALVLAGVPQIVVPHAGDQARQALGVQRTGVGIALRPADVDVDSLQRALATLLPDRAPTRAAASRLRAEFAALGGIHRAADLIEEVANDSLA